jgi:hypothetical protein
MQDREVAAPSTGAHTQRHVCACVCLCVRETSMAPASTFTSSCSAGADSASTGASSCSWCGARTGTADRDAGSEGIFRARCATGGLRQETCGGPSRDAIPRAAPLRACRPCPHAKAGSKRCALAQRGSAGRCWVRARAHETRKRNGSASERASVQARTRHDGMRRLQPRKPRGR